MPRFFTDSEYAAIDAACARLIPTDDQPGAHEARVVDYIDGLLGAFASDPPLIWAGGPFSGRFGGTPSFASFHHLTPLEELAWRTRIEGSLGLPERERLGPVEGFQEVYRNGLKALGTDFASVSSAEQDERLRTNKVFTAMLYAHACQGMYGAPEYGGNQGEVGWKNIDFAGDVQPRGYTDAEVSQRD